MLLAKKRGKKEAQKIRSRAAVRKSDSEEESDLEDEEYDSDYSDAGLIEAVKKGIRRLVVRRAENEPPGNLFTSVPNVSAIRGTFRNKTIFFNGHFTYEINDFFHEAIDNGHTLYIIRELKKFMDVHGGNTEDLSTFFGCALRIVVETPIELGQLGREEETKNVANCADNETTAKADDEKKNDGKDDSESDGNESESDESIMNDTPFFKFVRAIVNNFLELSTGRSRHGRIPDDESCVKRIKFCAKFRAKIFNDWSWEDNFFDELFNTYTGEVLRILRIPVTDDGHADDADSKFVLHDVFVLRCAREEMDTLASDLNALFAPDQFDCRVICVEKPPEKVAKYL